MAKISNREVMWNRISRTVFQDRVISFSKWEAAINDSHHVEHLKILTQSLMMLNPAAFITLLGKDNFISKWHELRTQINYPRKSVVDSIIILDRLWASIATGFAYVNPQPRITKSLSKGVKSTFQFVSRNTNPVNIYEISRQTNRAYNRTHADINQLESLGLINTTQQIIDGRQNRLVKLAAYSGQNIAFNKSH